jgi:hypothetical protein
LSRNPQGLSYVVWTTLVAVGGRMNDPFIRLHNLDLRCRPRQLKTVQPRATQRRDIARRH